MTRCSLASFLSGIPQYWPLNPGRIWRQTQPPPSQPLLQASVFTAMRSCGLHILSIRGMTPSFQMEKLRSREGR